MSLDNNKFFPITSVVAVTPAWGIGQNGTVPWQQYYKTLKKDLAYFRETTIKTTDPKKLNLAIMGRKTWESIPSVNRPLKNRINVILSTTMPSHVPDITNPSSILSIDTQPYVFTSFPSLIDFFTLHYALYNSIIEKFVVIGGGRLFEESFFHPWFRCLHLTYIRQEFPECDTYLGDSMIDYLERFVVRRLLLIRDQETEKDNEKDEKMKGSLTMIQDQVIEDGIEYMIVEYDPQWLLEEEEEKKESS